MSTTPPLPSLRVASASFFHRDCNQQLLFHSEYKRSNRTKGLKILRCFPHCCPEHIDRSYCGTSLSVRVELGSQHSGVSLTDLPPRRTLAVFARLGTVNDVDLRPGEYLTADKLMSSTQSESNLDGQWVAGTLEQPSGLSTRQSPRNPMQFIFDLNNKSYSRWNYDWESGATKTQKQMKHVLKTYIVERCAVDRDDNFTAFTSRQAYAQLFRVLHVVSSPEFTVISYRRAKSEKYQTELPSSCGIPLHGLSGGGASQHMGSAVYGGELVDARSGLYSARRFHFQSPNDARSSSRDYQADFQRTAVYPAHSLSGSALNDLLKDKLRWERANLTSVTVSRNLALVFSFLQWAPLSVYASSVDTIVHLVHRSLLEALPEAPNKISRLNCFSMLLLGQIEGTAGTAVEHFRGGAPLALPRELEILLRVLANALVWFFSTETRHWIRDFFRQHARSLLDKHALRGCFVLFVQKLQDRLNTNVFARSELRSLETAAEEVIAVVYSNKLFHARRPQVWEILSGQNFAGWIAFVAQMRETYVNASKCSTLQAGCLSDLNFGQAHSAHNSLERDWNAEWLLEIDKVVWETMNEEVDFRDLAIDVQASTLHVRSTQGVAGVLDCMSLVLDGKERVFAMFPNGIASGIDAGRSGDYIGELQIDQSGQLAVYLQICQWSVCEGRPSYQLRARIQCWRSGRLCVSGYLMATTAPFSFSPEEVLRLGEMPLHHKRKAVSRSFAVQREQNGIAKSAAPWKEFGRFRLSYLKA